MGCKFEFVLFYHRIAGVKCIMSAFQVHDHVNNSKNNLRHQIANVIFIVIPKILGTLTLISSEKGISNNALKAVSIISIIEWINK